MSSIARFSLTGNIIPKRSAFNLEYSKLFNCEMGQLIPVMHDVMTPGDIYHLSNEIVVRFTPLVAPILHEVNAFVHYFFVPFRLLDDDWEDFITGGEDGTDTSTLPRWDNHSDTAKYSLWDYFGFPTGVTVPASHDMSPIDYIKRAYNLIYNTHYRDQLLQTELNITTAKDVQRRNWAKDYFTTCLTAQQKGTAPALPISGIVNPTYPAVNAAGAASMDYGNAGNNPGNTGTKTLLELGDIDLSGASTFDTSDLRTNIAIQRWMEINNRAGSRYVEWLNAIYDIAPRDERLQNPEYISGSRQSIIISEVLNTSSTATEEQGNMAGHGLSANKNNIGSYRANEFGIIMGILSIMPTAVYGQGIDRQWLRQTRYDFPNPLFANLSEQEVYTAELFMDGSANDDDIFGYQGRYDECRSKKDMYCADFRDTYDYWTLGRQFSAAPTLNSAFITCDPRQDIFAVQSEPGCIVHISNKITAVSPLPIMNNPGRMDHAI
jgi:hypothetical protein